MKERILVTGGAGFIGSHLTEALLTQGYAVTVIDDLSTGKRTNLPEHPELTFFEGDVGDPLLLAQALPDVQAVFHLAAVASVQASIVAPVGTHESNLLGTLHLLEAARQCGTPRIIYASSAAVYGEQATQPIREGNPLEPMSPYAIDKLSGEYYLDYYARQYGLSALALRFFNIYGPRQDPSSPYSGVISIFAERARAGEAVTIYGDGQQSRDFVYVGDLVRILMRSLHVPLSGMQVANVGTGHPTTLLELLGELEPLVGRAVFRRFAPARPGDIRHSYADNRKLLELLGAMNWTQLKEGLARTLAP